MPQLQHRRSNEALAANALADFVVVSPRVMARRVDEPEIGRDASALYDHGGAVVVAGAWLAFYVFAALHGFMAFAS